MQRSNNIFKNFFLYQKLIFYSINRYQSKKLKLFCFKIASILYVEISKYSRYSGDENVDS